MTAVFLSDCYNHHQSAFSEAMYKLTNGSYIFIATKPLGNMRRSLGWGIENEPPFLKKWYESEEEKKACEALINEADVVITGSAPEQLLTERIKNGKMIIRYNERIYKKYSFIDTLKIPLRRMKHKKLYRHENMYMLCSSAYTAADYALTGNFKGKTYKWGYFPKTEIYENIDELIEQKQKNSILWVSRFIDWKHPEIPVEIAKRLKDDGYSFTLNMIGNGELEPKIKDMIDKIGLGDQVHMLGSMKPEEVRSNMEKSFVFMITSDRNEGWGAVLNESMNSGCAVVANASIGSVPFLMKHEYNGIMYRDGDIDGIYDAVKSLLDDAKKCRTLGKRAYETVVTVWNSDVAAQRLLILINELHKNGKCSKFENGPCSHAEILKDDWFKK